MRRIVLFTTGGTIEKTYDETTGELLNRRSIVDRMLAELRLEGVDVEVRELMSKDSLYMTEEDRMAIEAAARKALDEARSGDSAPAASPVAGVVILHGTDTLEETGARLHRTLGTPPVPVILTGAIRPFEMKRSDALQNLTEALFATGALAAGVYCVAHGQALPFPGVTKDRARNTFVARSDAEKPETTPPSPAHPPPERRPDTLEPPAEAPPIEPDDRSDKKTDPDYSTLARAASG